MNRETAKRCVGKGWYGLIDEFYDKFPDANVEQVKEKFGTLRLYHTNCSDESTDLEIDIMNRSETICELCGGEIKQPILDKDWIYSLCKKCYGEKQEQRNA